MSADAKIAVFEETIVLPALKEVSTAPALLRDFAASVVVKRPVADPNSETLLADLANAFGKRTGPSLVLIDRFPPAVSSPIGGRFAMTVLYDVVGDEVFAAPGVMFWMAFNNRLHGFLHRYDTAIAQHRVEDITKNHVLNQMLGSVTFYQVQAFSPAPFPGYQ